MASELCRDCFEANEPVQPGGCLMPFCRNFKPSGDAPGNPGMVATQRSLEDEAERLIRHAASDRLPVDAGTVSKARGLIGDSWRAGRSDAFRHIRAILAEMHDDWGEADPLAMRDALAEAVRDATPESWCAAGPGEGSRTWPSSS